MRASPALAVLCAASAAQAQWSVDAQATRQYDSNVSRGQLPADVLGDRATRLSLAASRELYGMRDTSLSFTGEAVLTAYERFHGLSSASLGGILSGRRKFGVGLASPWLVLSASAARESYRETIRNGMRYAVALTGGRRFSEAFDARLGARYDRRRGDNDVPDVPGVSGRAFDLQGRSLFARAGMAVSPSLLVSFGVRVRRGDVASTVRETPGIVGAANAISPDPAFGDEHYAYRLSGVTRAASLALSWALDAHSSIDVGLEGERTRARGGFGYRGTLLGVHYVYAR